MKTTSAAPCFSIIIPVYNVESFLRQCIQSVLSQSFTDWELILVDDGSSDSSGQICDEYAYADRRIAVHHKSNGGVSSARNIGITQASGEYIVFVDSDDWLEPDYLSSLYEVRNFDIVFFPFKAVATDGFSTEYTFPATEATENEGVYRIFTILKENGCSNHNFFGYTWNKLFKRSIIEQNDISFVEGLRISEDEVFTLSYCKHVSTAKLLTHSIYNYRLMSNGLTSVRNNSDEYYLLAQSLVAEANGYVSPMRDQIMHFAHQCYRSSFVFDNSAQRAISRCLGSPRRVATSFYPDRALNVLFGSNKLFSLLLLLAIRLKNRCKSCFRG